MTPELQAIVERLDKIEKEVNHLGSMTVARTDTETILYLERVEARSFVVRDMEGTERASLRLADRGPLLALFDANGNVRAGLGVTPEGPFLELYDGNKKCRVRLQLDGESGPWLGLYDAEGLLRLDALVEDGHGPMLFLRDKSTNPRVSAQVLEDVSSVSLRDASTKKVASLKVFQSGTAQLFMGEYGPSETQTTVGPSLKLAIDGDTPRLLFGKDNEVFWSAPYPVDGKVPPHSPTKR